MEVIFMKNKMLVKAIKTPPFSFFTNIQVKNQSFFLPR